MTDTEKRLKALRDTFGTGWFTARQTWSLTMRRADLDALAEKGLLDTSKPSRGPVSYRVAGK